MQNNNSYGDDYEGGESEEEKHLNGENGVGEADGNNGQETKKEEESKKEEEPKKEEETPKEAPVNPDAGIKAIIWKDEELICAEYLDQEDTLLGKAVQSKED